jgi:hypothetical protein
MTQPRLGIAAYAPPLICAPAAELQRRLQGSLAPRTIQKKHKPKLAATAFISPKRGACSLSHGIQSPHRANFLNLRHKKTRVKYDTAK